MDHLEWRLRELADSPAFDRALTTLRTEAHRDRRQSKRFAELTLDDLAVHVEQRRALPRDQRPYAWREGRVDRDTINPAPNDPAAAAERYLKGCQAFAGHYFGATAAAMVVHAAAAATAPVVIEPVGPVDYPAPSGGTASSAAAALTGADWRAPSTRRMALMRATPADRSGFIFRVGVSASR